MKKTIAIIVAAVGLVTWSLSASLDAAADDTQREFLGATKCRTCHKKPEQGEQFKIWSESAHANAYQTLGSEKAKAIAKEKGIDDPQKADECLRCHVTGHGVAADFLGTKYDMTEGVTCESCHGAGGDYYKKKTMEAITAGEIDGATVGLVMPDEKVCAQCHNEESPTFKPFNFEERAKKIAHPLPEALRAEYEK